MERNIPASCTLGGPQGMPLPMVSPFTPPFGTRKSVVAIAGVVHGVCLFACNVFPVLHPSVLHLASTRHAVEGLSVSQHQQQRPSRTATTTTTIPGSKLFLTLRASPVWGDHRWTVFWTTDEDDLQLSQQGTRPPVFLPAFRNIGTTDCPKTQAFLLRP